MEPNYIEEDSRRRRAHQDVDARRAGGRRGQAPAGQRRAPAHRLQAHRGHAGRALRHRRDRRLGDPDAEGHHPGRGRRGHRLRNDGLQDHAAAPRTCRTTWRRCVRRSSARCRTAVRRARATPARGARCRARSTRRGRELEPRLRRALPRLPEAGARPTTAPTWARWEPATTSSRSASTNRASSGSCCTRARAASATRSARMFIELAKQDAIAQQRQPARPRPGVLRGRLALLRRLRARRRLGAEVRAR